MSTLPTVSLRRGVFAGTAIAGLAVSSLFPSQSLAQTMPSPANYQGTATCAKLANGPGFDKAVQCEARQLDRRIAAAHQRGVDADRRAAEADRVSECTGFLIAGVKKGLFTKGAVLEVAKGKVTAANACEAARSFGYNQKAELGHPAVQ